MYYEREADVKEATGNQCELPSVSCEAAMEKGGEKKCRTGSIVKKAGSLTSPRDAWAE